MLGIQSLAALCLASWGVLSTMILLWIINKIVPIRMEPNEELLGADLTEHRINHSSVMKIFSFINQLARILMNLLIFLTSSC